MSKTALLIEELSVRRDAISHRIYVRASFPSMVEYKAAQAKAKAMMRVVEAVRADFGEYTGKATAAALAALDGLEKK